MVRVDRFPNLSPLLYILRPTLPPSARALAPPPRSSIPTFFSWTTQTTNWLSLPPEKEFTSKSVSKITLPPFGLFAKLTFPPCTETAEPTYATVQFGKNRHLSLGNDLVYINHSCEPSLVSSDLSLFLSWFISSLALRFGKGARKEVQLNSKENSDLC